VFAESVIVAGLSAAVAGVLNITPTDPKLIAAKVTMVNTALFILKFSVCVSHALFAVHTVIVDLNTLLGHNENIKVWSGKTENPQCPYNEPLDLSVSSMPLNKLAKNLCFALAVLFLSSAAHRVQGSEVKEPSGSVDARTPGRVTVPKSGNIDAHIIDVVSQFETRGIEANDLRRAGDLKGAIDLFRKNYELVKANFGEKDILVAVAGDELAFALLKDGVDSEALQYRDKSFEICKSLAQELESRLNEFDINGNYSAIGPDTDYGGLPAQVGRVGGLDRMASLLTQGLLNSLGGKFDKIDIESVDTAWRLSSHISDEPPTDSKCYLFNIIEVRYYLVRNFNRSRLCLQKLIEIAPKARDKTILQNAIRRLAQVCLAQADFLSAVKYANAALAVDKRFEEKANSPAQQEDVLILAKAASGLHLHDDARKRYEQLLEMYDELPPSPEVQLDAFEEWSSILINLGDYSQAYEGFSICKKRSEQIYGADSAQYAFNCQFLGWAAFKLDKLEEAERELKTALSIKSKLKIENRDTYSMLSRFYFARGDKERSRDLLRKSIDASVSYLERISDLPLAEQIALLNDQSQTMLDQLLTECETSSLDADLYDQVLRCRGMLVDSLHARAQITRRAKGDEEYKSLERDVQNNRDKLVALRTLSALKEGPEVFQQLEELESSQRKMFEYLNTKYGKSVVEECTMDELSAHLKPGECLIDAYKFTQLNTGKTLYGAFLVRHGVSPQFIRLGESAMLEQRLNDWIRAIRLNQKYSTVVKQFETGADVASYVEGCESLSTARSVISLPTPHGKTKGELELRSQFIETLEPLAKALTVADSRLIICCDGELFRVPWSLALDRRFSIAELDNPKQLLDRGATRSLDNKSASILLVGDVDFSSTGLPVLSASKEEVKQIFDTTLKSVAVPPRVLTQHDANKKNILDAMTENNFVHLATHGLFLSPLGDRADSLSSQSVGWVFSQRSPLLDSAIYVASSNKSQPADAEISADEILSLDLTKNQHVALSACETGLGESFRGQGVLGLRTAFAAAGTQTILMSLWPVDDVATGELMAEYYRQMFDEKLKPAAALAAAQKLVEKKWKNPYYWAGWVLVGNAW
jgi:CHAT domain-containing protein